MKSYFRFSLYAKDVKENTNTRRGEMRGTQILTVLRRLGMQYILKN